MSLTLDEVDRELARLWATTSRKDSHAMTLTLVVFCANPEDLPRAREAIAKVALSRPCRTISIACHPDHTPSIEATVALHLRGAEPVSEDIDLAVRGTARKWIPSTLVRMRATDLPVCVWWVGDLPERDTLYDELVAHSDVVLIHSADMDLGDLSTVARLCDHARGGYAIADLNWARLRPWQEFTARFFDDPSARERLKTVRTVTIEHSVRADERASTQAALYAGWLASGLGWSPDGASWEGHAVTLSNGVTLRFVPVERPELLPGAINRVELCCPTARFEVKRGDMPLVLCWDGEGEGLVVPSQCVRIAPPDDSLFVSMLIERLERNRLYERSLYFTARLIEQQDVPDALYAL